MELLNYKDLNLSSKIESKSFDWEGKTIEVAQYMPIQDKCDLIEATLQESYENGVYSELKLDAYFHLNLIYLYTNIVFSDEDRADEAKLIDELETSGFMDAFMHTINEREYNYLYEALHVMVKVRRKQNNTIKGIVDKLLIEMPEAMETAKGVMESFDKEKFAEVMAFAKAANGGRDIPTN